jgi:hypothetical protein
MPQMPQPLMALDLLERAEEFYQAYRDLPRRKPPSWPRYFMLCHAIELALKAYILFRGQRTMSQLEKQELGHKLDKLLSEAVTAGLLVGILARSEIELLNEAHTKYWARYPKKDDKPVFVIDDFEVYAVELLRAIATSLRGPNYWLYVRY